MVEMDNSDNQNNRSVMLRIGQKLQGFGLAIRIGLHAVMFALSFLLAQLIRFDFAQMPDGWFFDYYLSWLPIFVILKLVIFGFMQLFWGGWRSSSIRDILKILVASWLFLLIVLPVIYLARYFPETDSGFETVRLFLASCPSSSLLLDFLTTIFFVSTARLGFRIYLEELRPMSSEGVKRVLIIGAGNAAETVVREIGRMSEERYRVVGLVDDNPSKKGVMIYSVPVLGTTDDIPRLCKDEKIEEILIAVPSASQEERRRIIELCSGTKLSFQSLPSVSDLIDGKVTVSQIKRVDINDLLGREAVQLDTHALELFLEGRNILITGAGGSIGSEMCRQVCRFAPSKLILVEQAETPLFDIENELRVAHRELQIIPCVCDIYDRDRVSAMWDLHRPDVVIHAAAHKHVPLMEWNPCEAVKNNVLGTKNVADMSSKYDVAEFVMISTDKAVNPSSVMGTSKRIAEIYTQALNGSEGCVTQFKAVRFGNVLGSNGSVVPTFRKQIAKGGPVTVTHPDMTRYFMTIPEAAQLVLQAAATGAGGQIFLLDMGESVKIVDLARNMITLSGFRPDEDIEIVFSGVRPGEKLYEELRSKGEDLEPTVHPKINIWKSNPTDWAKVNEDIAKLEKLINWPKRQEIVDAFKEIVPEYTPLNPPDKQK